MGAGPCKLGEGLYLFSTGRNCGMAHYAFDYNGEIRYGPSTFSFGLFNA